MDALSHPDPNAMFSYTRGPNGEIIAEDEGEVPSSKEEGERMWRWEMTMRFLRGFDNDFDYKSVDENDAYDDLNEEQERYFDDEDPEWILEEGSGIQARLQGETGIQDF